jgi:hypothetical protein
MDLSLQLPNGVVVDKRSDKSYMFYYGHIPNNSTVKTTRRPRKYQCYLDIAIHRSDNIHIDDFDCMRPGEGKGKGKILLCTSLKYLKDELGLKDDTRVSLTAMSLDKKEPRKSQDKLISYYTKKYGFQVISEKLKGEDMYMTDMSTTIANIISHCSRPSTPKQSILNRLQRALTFRRRTPV